MVWAHEETRKPWTSTDLNSQRGKNRSSKVRRGAQSVSDGDVFSLSFVPVSKKKHWEGGVRCGVETSEGVLLDAFHKVRRGGGMLRATGCSAANTNWQDLTSRSKFFCRVYADARHNLFPRMALPDPTWEMLGVHIS